MLDSCTGKKGLMGEIDYDRKVTVLLLIKMDLKLSHLAILILKELLRLLVMNSVLVRWMIPQAENNVEVASCELTVVHMDREIRKSCPLPKEIFRKGVELCEQN